MAGAGGNGSEVVCGSLRAEWWVVSVMHSDAKIDTILRLTVKGQPSLSSYVPPPDGVPSSWLCRPIDEVGSKTARSGEESRPDGPVGSKLL
jgi:hypothetical protein